MSPACGGGWDRHLKNLINLYKLLAGEDRSGARPVLAKAIQGRKGREVLLGQGKMVTHNLRPQHPTSWGISELPSWSTDCSMPFLFGFCSLLLVLA